MNIFDVIKKPHIIFDKEKQVVGFYGSFYSPVFFNIFWKKIRDINVIPEKITYILLENSGGLSELKIILNQSFLGIKKHFWLGNIKSCLKDKKFEGIIDYLINYDGPHYIYFFTSEQVNIKDTIILFPEKIMPKMVNDIFKFLDIDFPRKKAKILEKLLPVKKTWNFDEVVRAYNYCSLLNNSSLLDIDIYLPFIFDESPNLYLLAEFFFEKKEHDFFIIWHTLIDSYTPLFWISFWEKQLWKAYFVCFFMHHKKMNEARIMSSRLPFSFIKDSWKYHSLQELKNAYSFLYKYDCNIKKGATLTTLELFFKLYFLDKFKK